MSGKNSGMQTIEGKRASGSRQAGRQAGSAMTGIKQVGNSRLYKGHEQFCSNIHQIMLKSQKERKKEILYLSSFRNINCYTVEMTAGTFYLDG